jgi:hypothetical protein
MATYLTLEGAKILETRGFGGGTHRGLHTVTLEDEVVFAVYSKGVFGGIKKIFWAKFGALEFYVGTVGVQSGGGWVGGGFGLRGTVQGAATASLLNALTTKNREYAVLTVIDHDSATGVQKTFSLGFQNIDEATLRIKLAQAIPAWTEPFIVKLEAYYKQPMDKEKAIKEIAFLKLFLPRGILSQEQANRLFPLLKELAPEALPEPVPQSTSTSRVEQLKILSDLRNSGALSEEEFQAEKLLLLGAAGQGKVG